MHDETNPSFSKKFAIKGYVIFIVVFLVLVACARSKKPERDQQIATFEYTLMGQLLLPIGEGSRGVEIQVTITETGNESRVVWVLFDEQGRFAHTFGGNLTRVIVTAGTEVYRIDIEDLPKVNSADQIDVGVIDLRDRLTTYRLRVRAAEVKPQGDVRVGMWFGLPPVGPYG